VKVAGTHKTPGTGAEYLEDETGIRLGQGEDWVRRVSESVLREPFQKTRKGRERKRETPERGGR